MDKAQIDRLRASVRASETFCARLVRDLDPFVRALVDGGVSVEDMTALLLWFWGEAAADQTRRAFSDGDD